MEHAQCVDVIGGAVIFNYPPAVRRVILNVHTGQVAPGAETTGQTQTVNALGTPFVMESLFEFGKADAEAIDAEPNCELAAGAVATTGDR